jgi:tetratricopeptide (TPR) repeat protein
VALLAVLERLPAQHVPHRAGLPVLHRAVSARPADSFPSPRPGGGELAPITIDYPAEGSIFPPDIAPPRFIWRDAREDSTVWLIEVSFSDGSAGIEVKTQGERLHIGEIDQRCVADTNKLPELTPEEAASWSWKPDAATWATIKQHSVEHPATVSITGFRDANATPAVSRGQCTVKTSKDPVGAPIFYRDVPLIPALGEQGVIKPLPDSIIPFIKWRLRNVGDTESRTLMTGLHTCANCHSFSRDGKTMGMDVDGAQNEKGLYSLTPVQPEMSIRSENVIKWSSFRPLEDSANLRVGFMSQVSPDGRYVVTMVNNPGPKGGPRFRMQDRIYVANFSDYRFGQVFYPTKGMIVWYDREARQLNLLPGADDPRYVQTGGVWSPDGKYIVFARAPATDPYPEGYVPAKFANDPNERPVHYDLYRLPFNDGKGGVPEPIAGASQNGMSNNFAKVSPDGRWIVFVQCRNGLLIRPDSKLYIVPFQGGPARRMNCNLSLMNSWHTFSPNGRWLAFSSKARTPYTQLFLTHLDEDGNDSPPILIENTTAANRAVNIPEFVNIPPDGLLKMDAPVTEFYVVFDHAVDLVKKKQYAAALAEWEKALELDPGDAKANYNYGLGLTRAGRLDEAIPHFEKAVEADPRFAEAYNNLGIVRVQKGRVDEAIQYFQKSVQLEPDYGDAHNNLGAALLQSGRFEEAIPHFQKAVEVIPDFADAHNNLGIALVQSGRPDEAIPHFQKAVEVKPTFADAHDNLGIVLLQKGKVDEAIPHFQKALEIDPGRVQTYYNLGGALYIQGKVTQALARWHEGLRADPNNLPLLNQTAWLLATCPQASVRNGPEAVELAERAVKVSADPDPVLLDTLAAAYAEVGRFPQAVQTAHQALDLATQQNVQPLVEGLKARIARYESKSPFRDTE